MKIQTKFRANEIGNKAYNLICLENQGVNIPKAEYLKSKSCEAIEKIYLENKNDNAIEEHINFLEIENNIGYPVIIRSSSTNEDTDSESNAGKYLSIYNISNRDELLKGVVKCWDYRDEECDMGIIIQKQLYPYFSGVVFIYEKDGKKEMIIELVIGLGELLVSGMITPMRVRYDYENGKFLINQKANQKIAQFPTPIGMEIEPTDDIRIREKEFRVLNVGENIFYSMLAYDEEYFDEVEKALFKIKEECEKIYDHNGNSDIEWVYTEEGELVIVQRRPITIEIESIDNDGSAGEYGGSTIVQGCRSGKLVHLNDYNGEENQIVFAPMILPKDFTLLMKCQGIISVECSLLSHSAILAREIQLPYWAGVNERLFENFKGQDVIVDFKNKTINLMNQDMDENINFEKNQDLKENECFNKKIFDIATYEVIDIEEHRKYTLVEDAVEMINRYYDEETIKKLKREVNI